MKTTKVTFEFDSREVALNFLGYMSDGGGEWNFLDLDDEYYIMNGDKRKPVNFDYNMKKLYCFVTSEKVSIVSTE